MTYQIVFFDIDGTLLNEEKRLPADTKDAISQLQDSGVEVVIATGRAPYFFREIAKELHVDSFVSLNGSYVVYQGKLIHAHELPKGRIHHLEEVASDRNHPLVYQGGENFFANRDNHPDILASFDSLQVPPPAYNPNYWKETSIYQGLLYCPETADDFYRHAFPDFTFIRWHRVAMDVIPGGVSKAVGIQKILQHAKIPVENAVAFGDGLNDLEMLAFVGMGVAMGNAHDTVKPYANYITKHVNDGGIAHGLRHLCMIP